MAKKTKISSIVDYSTMGVNLGTEMSITRNTSQQLRKALSRASKDGLRNFAANVVLLSGDPLRGNASFGLEMPKKNPSKADPYTIIRYDFKQQGSNYFLNVGGNPTSLICGANDVPVLIQGFSNGKDNSATVTFRYLNRVLYAVFDTLLKDYGFQWSGEDKKKLVAGDISIHSYQLAWYSGDLGDQRDAVYRFIRAIYGGQDATSERVINVGRDLGIVARLHDNHDSNLTLEARLSDRRSFSLTFYSKDQQPGYVGENKNRLANLIRWDCTLNTAFLTKHAMKTVKELEDTYVEVCNELGYDLGFVRYISSKVEERIKLPYMLKLKLSDYKKSIAAMEEITSPAAKKIIDHWLNYGASFETDKEAGAFFDITREAFNRTKAAILKLGIDITFPRATHEAILENRINSMRTIVERGHSVTSKAGSNRRIPWEELVDRDEAMLKDINTTLDNAEGALRVRKLKPTKVKPEQFWIYKPAVNK